MDDPYNFDSDMESIENNSSSLSQNSFSNLSASFYQVVQIERIVGYRQKSEILFCIADYQMYGFNTKSVLGKSYLCTYKVHKNKHECKSRIYEVDNNIFIKLNCTPDHTHPDRLAEKKELFCLNEIKCRCGMLESFLSTTRLTVRDIFNQVLLENPGVQLPFTKYERTLQLIRDKTIPKNPTNCGEIFNAFQDETILNTLGRSKHVDKSIFFDGVVEKNTHSFCVFSSKFAISLIQSHIEPARRHFMVDATFKVVPVGPFYQLLILYCAYIKCVSH